MKRFLLTAILLAVSFQAQAAPTMMRSILTSGDVDDRAVDLWLQKFSPVGPKVLFYQTYKIGPTNFTFMAGDAADCTDMDGGFRSCPLRVIIQSEKASRTEDLGLACIPNLWSPEFAADMRIVTEYDAASHLVAIRSVKMGMAIDSCTQSFSTYKAE